MLEVFSEGLFLPSCIAEIHRKHRIKTMKSGSSPQCLVWAPWTLVFSSMLEPLGWARNTFSSEIWSAQKQWDQKTGRNKVPVLTCVSPCPQCSAPGSISACRACPTLSTVQGFPQAGAHFCTWQLPDIKVKASFSISFPISPSVFFFPVSILFLVQLFCFVLFPFLSIGTTQIPLLIGASGSLLVTSYYISQGFAFSSRRLLQQCPQHNSVLWRVPLPLELLVAHIQHWGTRGLTSVTPRFHGLPADHGGSPLSTCGHPDHVSQCTPHQVTSELLSHSSAWHTSLTGDKHQTPIICSRLIHTGVFPLT